MSWLEEAWRVIDEVNRTLPADATLADRKAALKAAYPFGPRRYHPYKQWCKAQQIYLARYKPRPLRPFTEGLFEEAAE